jgi:hypothetical protein
MKGGIKMTNEELQIWKEVFPFGLEVYYDGDHPTRFADEMISRHGLRVKNGGSVCRVDLPIHLFTEVCGGPWRGQIGGYNIWE